MSKHQSTQAWLARAAMALAILLSVALVAPPVSPAVAQGTQLAEAVVLVNSNSTNYTDFQHYIQPYLDHFGIPYTVHDVASTPVTADIGNYALIVIGHRQIDLTYTDLDLTEQGYIRDAVLAGSGLVNFDGQIADGNTGLYLHIESIFGFRYNAIGTDYGVSFPILSGDMGTVIDCTNDANQDPVLVTQPSNTVINPTDGAWTEMEYLPRLVTGLFAGLDEENNGLPVMHCFATGIPDGQYEVYADLYTDGFGQDLTYHYGYSAANPKQFSVDTEGRSGGEDRFGEYSLGNVTISGGSFDIYFQDADVRTFAAAAESQALLENLYGQPVQVLAQPEPYFGWSTVRLVPVGTPAPTMHWISQRHEPDEWIGTESMLMSGINENEIGPNAAIVAMSYSEPLVVVATAGTGRAVHWASYDWMSYAVKGPLYGLDDLVWRSMVWAARKPFVMQGMPPIVTMRVDDSNGPYDWIETVNDFGIKPWAGLFYEDVGILASTQLSGLVNNGMATASVHAKNQSVTTTGVFYYDHGTGNLPDGTVTTNFAAATAWHTTRNIPIASFVVPQFYEFGTNVFEELQAWGVEFVFTVVEPGTDFDYSITPTPTWIMDGPFRLYEAGDATSIDPVYYADYLEIPGHPELDGTFFNCGTEIRDDATYEWYPNNDVLGSVGRGTRQLKRALDAMALPMLTTHEPFIDPITPTNLNAIMQGITSNLASYNLIGMTMDEACQYTRATYTSDISGAVYNPAQSTLTVSFDGQTDIPTMFYLFTGQGSAIQQQLVNVPQFTGSTQVDVPVEVTQGFNIYLPIAIKN